MGDDDSRNLYSNLVRAGCAGLRTCEHVFPGFNTTGVGSTPCYVSTAFSFVSVFVLCLLAVIGVHFANLLPSSCLLVRCGCVWALGVGRHRVLQALQASGEFEEAYELCLMAQEVVEQSALKVKRASLLLIRGRGIDTDVPVVSLAPVSPGSRYWLHSAIHELLST